MIIFLLCIIAVLAAVIAVFYKKINGLNNTVKTNAYELERQLSELEAELNLAKAGRHDYKNHLITLGGLIEQDKKSDALIYIKELASQNSKRSKIATGNAVADSILNAKAQQMHAENIKFTLDANLPLRLNIQAPSLTAILANLLDNAAQAAKQCKNGYVDLKMKYTKSNFIIIIKNPYEGEIVTNAQKISTTKQDKKNHGFGLDIVQLTVKRLRGTCEIEHDDNIFSVSVIIPV